MGATGTIAIRILVKPLAVAARFWAILALWFACAFVVDIADAAQFRKFNKIRTPAAVQKDLPEGFLAVPEPIRLPRSIVSRLLRDFLKTWNGGELEDHLAGDFYDRNRLLNTISEDVPRDARLRLVSIQGVDTLDQSSRAIGRGRFVVVSRVAARARIQIEFTDPGFGLRRIETNAEYIFKVTMGVRKK